MRNDSVLNREDIPNAAIFLKTKALEFLQIIFHSLGEGTKFYYDQDDTKTRIQITDQHAVDQLGTHIRPGIIGVRGPVSSSMQMGLGGNNLEQLSMKTGQQTFNSMLTGSMAFSCISREGYEAEEIAHLVFNSFKYFAPLLRKTGFFAIKSLNIGSEVLVNQEGDHDDLYLVPVYVTADIQDRWTLNPDVERHVRNIIISSSTE